MADLNEVLEKWFKEYQDIPSDAHLLCPKISHEDNEDYRSLDERTSQISLSEKKKRIEAGNHRLEVTYWNSLIFGFEKQDAGKWLEFTNRLDECLKQCDACVLNWHMQRRNQLKKFADRWDEEIASHIEGLLDRLDISRINYNLTWAQKLMEKIEATGATFRKAQLGDQLPLVLITVYEALCCVPFIATPENRQLFQYVFMRLQGKNYLKLGTKTPVPGMTYFLFDQTIEDRYLWARENWKSIEEGSLTEAQFDWAVNDGLIKGISEASKWDPTSSSAVQEFLKIERFWLVFEGVLRVFSDELVVSRLRSLEVPSNCPSIYDLLFRHIQFGNAEAILVVCIRVLTCFLTKAPKAFWDVIGDAKPNVIADLLFGNKVYKYLLAQSLNGCWGVTDSAAGSITPFPTSWITPWLNSLSRERRYDACEVLLHTLFNSHAHDQSIGEVGQAACIRAGLDALDFTLKSFLDPSIQLANGTLHLHASGTFNLVVKHKKIILGGLNPPKTENEGWITLKVSEAASNVLNSAMSLDGKLLAAEFQALYSEQAFDYVVKRQSQTFWESFVKLFETTSQPVELTRSFLSCLEPLVPLEQIRPLKNGGKLDEPTETFNCRLKAIFDVLVRIFGRISALQESQLATVFSDRLPFRVMIGLSVHDNSDVAEASVNLLNSMTGQFSRASALEQMTRTHPEQTLSSIVWTLERVLVPPYPWGHINPLLNLSRDILRGLTDPAEGLLRTKSLTPKMASIVLRWWHMQWRFVSKSCLCIEDWSLYIRNSVMTEFCRDIMELAEALINEDGLLMHATARKKDVASSDALPPDMSANAEANKEAMSKILEPAKENFRGMEIMIRLKDRWLVEVTVRVLCKILTRLGETGLEIHSASRKLITDACVPTGSQGKYQKSTNLRDQQRAELLRALGHDAEPQVAESPTTAQPASASPAASHSQLKKQSKLDAWSKSAPSTRQFSTERQTTSNSEDVRALSRSADHPIVKQLAAAQSKPKSKVIDARAISALKESRRREKEEREKGDAEAITKAKQIRGELPSKRGGQDQIRSEIMVNSSDEDSEGADAESDVEGQIVALSTGGKRTLDKHEKRRQQVLRDRIRIPVRKERRQRSFKEMRARIIPPMDTLHNTILAWDIFHEGNDPPSGPASTRVSSKYPHTVAYKETFFPLLASEAWRSFVTAKDEVTSPPFDIKLAGRASVDSYLEATFSLPKAQNKEQQLLEGDILLVSKDPNPLANPHAVHCLARVHLVQYKKDMVEVTFRVTARNNFTALHLKPQEFFSGIKITTMTTIEREYAALESLQYYDLMDEILKAEPSPVIPYSDERISNTMRTWDLNKAQALAVLGAHENDGFTLIQGPPGTGKTKTIVAMVGSLLSEQLRRSPDGISLANPSLLSKTQAGSGQKSRTKSLLVCAPSNAAVDELVLRLKAGVHTLNGEQRKINVVRLGRKENMAEAVKDVSLESLVSQHLKGENTQKKAVVDQAKLHEDAGQIKEKLEQLRPLLEAARGQLEQREHYLELTRQFDELKRQQGHIGKLIDTNKDSGTSIAREIEMRRRQVQQQILTSADVVCATLSTSGHDIFRHLDVEFETVIIDEAAQCVELSALIPLKYGCCKCILVGDPKQLPPTVLSQSAATFGYDQSLFVRMQQNHPESVHLLDMQYRMHPEISKFPSREFYEGQLQDGQDMVALRKRPWHACALFGPYRFFDVEGVQQKGSRGQSLINMVEVDVALQMYDALRRHYSKCDLAHKIGIITPYKAQLFQLRNRFAREHGEEITEIIDFNTTDAFQGRECEIIIFSCVRASSTSGIGFMTDIRRMNVGLTRAKSSLWILGDARALWQGTFWQRLIVDAQDRDLYTKGDIKAQLQGELELAKRRGGSLPRPRQAVSREVVMEDAPDLVAPPKLPIKAAVGAPKPAIKAQASAPKPSIIAEASAPKPLIAQRSREGSAASSASGKMSRESMPSSRSPISGSSSVKPKKSVTFALDPATEEIPLNAPPRTVSSERPQAVRTEGNAPTDHAGRSALRRNEPTEPRKRSLSPTAQREGGPKRLATNNSLPRTPTIGVAKPNAAPQDPSAMQVLGLVPPDRLPARSTSEAGALGREAQTKGTSSPAPNGPSPSDDKRRGVPRPRPKPSVFLPKRRQAR